MTKVSFIVLVDDKLANIEECIVSITNQKCIEKEIILISNTYSEKDITSVISDLDLCKEIYYVCDKNLKNVGSLRNKSLECITGDFVCFANSNDFYEENSVHKLVKESISSGSEVVIGRVYELDSKNGAYEFKKIDKSLKGKQVLKSNENLAVLKDLFLNNKLFNVDSIRKHNLSFADTEYYDYYPFVVNALIASKTVSLIPKAHYVERIKVGLDKIKNPIREERIDESQVSDMIKVLNFMIGKPYDNLAVEIMKEKYLKFLIKRGMKYKNISQDVTSLFDKISDSLNCIDLTKYKLSNKNLKILSLIKNKKYEEYFDYLEELRKSSEKKKNFKIYLTYTIFKNLYNIMTLLPIRENRVLFLSHSPGMDGNFEYIYDEVVKHNKSVRKKERFDCKFATTKTGLFGRAIMPIKLARAEYIILCENVPFFQHIEVREDTKVIQSWHAAGAFKKFGFSTCYLDGGPNPFENKKVKIHCGYDYATVSSKEVAQHYAEAFRLDVDKVIPVGLPRADFFFDEKKVNDTRERVYKLYPKLKDRKVILYAPTFRGFGQKRKSFEMEFDMNEIARNIPDEYIIALKLHPSVESSDIIIDEDVKDKVINISEYKDANDILTITDLLITDYSSIIFDYSLLGKPMIFYAYDLEEYLVDRDFYYEYEEFIPGPLARTNKDIIELINNDQFDLDVVDRFCRKFFVEKDGKNSKRFVEEVLLKI